MSRKILFVGDKRSKTAIRMNVTWQDGRLATKVLFEALAALGLSNDDYEVIKAYYDNGHMDRDLLQKLLRFGMQGYVIVGMGRRAQQALERLNVKHLKMIHPAARGRIRRRELYRAHVAEVLKEHESD